MSMKCARRWSSKPRDQYHVLSTTPTTPMTSRPPTTPDDFVVTSSTAAGRRSLAEDVGHVTYSDVDDWSRRGGTLERPPLYETEEGYDAKSLMKAESEAEALNTVRHWVKHGDVQQRPAVYRELVDDFDDELRQEDKVSQEHHHHDDDRPPGAVVHVHHVHEVDDHGISVVDDVEAAKRSASATVGGSSTLTQRPSGGEDPQRKDNDLSRSRESFTYNVEEGLTTLDSFFVFTVLSVELNFRGYTG